MNALAIIARALFVLACIPFYAAAWVALMWHGWRLNRTAH